MTEFVLVPGAWLGAWSWSTIMRELRGRGDVVYPITLPGLSELDEMDVAEIGLETHVSDVVDVLEQVDARGVVMVAHSYGGIVAGMAAQRAGNRVAHTIFVDAFLPNHGKSMMDAFGSEVSEYVQQQIAANDGRWPPPPTSEFEAHGVPPAQAKWLTDHALGQPGRTITEPATLTQPLSQLSATYIKCTQPHGEVYSEDVEALRQESDWRFMTLNTGHWPMLSTSSQLRAMLFGIGGMVSGDR